MKLKRLTLIQVAAQNKEEESSAIEYYFQLGQDTLPGPEGSGKSGTALEARALAAMQTALDASPTLGELRVPLVRLAGVQDGEPGRVVFLTLAPSSVAEAEEGRADDSSPARRQRRSKQLLSARLTVDAGQQGGSDGLPTHRLAALTTDCLTAFVGSWNVPQLIATHGGRTAVTTVVGLLQLVLSVDRSAGAAGGETQFSFDRDAGALCWVRRAPGSRSSVTSGSLRGVGDAERRCFYLAFVTELPAVAGSGDEVSGRFETGVCVGYANAGDIVERCGESFWDRFGSNRETRRVIYLFASPGFEHFAWI